MVGPDFGRQLRGARESLHKGVEKTRRLTSLHRGVLRRSCFCSIMILCLTASLASGSQSAQARPGPGHGFRKCGVIGHAVRATVYAKYLGCDKAIRIMRAYEHGGPFSYERGWNELCLRNFTGWCCGGGGGSFTCVKGKSIATARSM